MNKQKPRNREYRTPPQLRMNQERASKLYPHRLITPKGVGNEPRVNFGFGER